MNNLSWLHLFLLEFRGGIDPIDRQALFFEKCFSRRFFRIAGEPAIPLHRGVTNRDERRTN